MPVQAVILICGVVIIILAIKWIRNSKAVDRFTTDLTEEKDFSVPETKDVIEKIGKAETGLGERAKEQKVKAEELTRKSDSIKEYLDTRKSTNPITINDRKDDIKAGEETPMK